MLFSPPAEGCLLKKGLPKGGTCTPGLPLATPLKWPSDGYRLGGKIYKMVYNNSHSGYDNCFLLFFELSIVHTIILCSTATLRKFLERFILPVCSFGYYEVTPICVTLSKSRNAL